MRSQFNGCDIEITRGSNQPIEVTKGEEVSFKENHQADLYYWTVSKKGRTKSFSGAERSQQAALRAAQEQASMAPIDRATVLTKL